MRIGIVLMPIHGATDPNPGLVAIKMEVRIRIRIGRQQHCYCQYIDWPHLVDLVRTGGGLGEDLTALHSLHHLSHRAHTL